MHVTTWNVLHRVHADNWNEQIAERDEPRRIARIAERVRTFDGAVCLQEVSGDQLAALPEPKHVLCYPRVPKPKHPCVLADLREYLVVLGEGRVVHSHAFSSDGGKGFLAVETASGIVVSTHVSWGPRMAAQLGLIADFVRNLPFAVVCGDFNADVVAVLHGLGDGFAAASLPAGAITRPRDDGAQKSQAIDHIIVWGGSAEEGTVAATLGLSDHAPVTSRCFPAVSPARSRG